MRQATKKHIVVIGAGFSGLSSAAYLAKAGHKVTVYEKNAQPGGRATTVFKDGFRFELGPSWYMMPDVFEEYFADFGQKVEDHYQLERLDPSYRVFFAGGRKYDLSNLKENTMLFSQLEPGAGVELERFLAKSKKRYEAARKHFLPLDYLRPWALLSPSKLRAALLFPLFGSYHSEVKKQFFDPRLQQILEFMTVFLGGSAREIPALYSLLAHVDMNLGIWYPKGGFFAMAEAFARHAKQQGASIRYNKEIKAIKVRDGRATAVKVDGKYIACDAVVGAADYYHIETKLLHQKYQVHSKRFWQRRLVSPSALLVSVGLDTKLQNLQHHNLFFDGEWEAHFKAIKQGQWLEEPLFYLCVPSKTDESAAPENHENLFILVPIPAGIDENAAKIEQIKQTVYARIGERAQIEISKHIVTEKVYAQQYFEHTFNAFKANAFGLAHSFTQSAFLRPSIKSKKVENLYFVGQFTNPGTGVPLCVLSGKVVANAVKRELYDA